MTLEAPAQNETGGAKRLLFSKPSWSRSHNLGSSELFHRSEQIYSASTIKLERKRRGTTSRQEKDVNLVGENAGRARKRQRIDTDKDNHPQDEDDDDDDDDGDDDDEDQDYDDDNDDGDGDGKIDENHGENSCRDQSSQFIEAGETPVAQATGGPMQGSLKHADACTNMPKAAMSCDSYQRKNSTSPLTRLKDRGLTMSTAVDLDDEGDEISATSDISTSKRPISTLKGASAADDIEASDDEFPELARKAREKARRTLLEERSPAQTAYPSPLGTSLSARFLASKASPPLDPILQILITCSIPNTTPLIVSRRLSQRLKDVRLAWADRQPFSRDFAQHVFLTWRGKRLFDVTTCKSLGVRVDADGRVLTKGDVLGDEEGRIHMEAMTSEILESRRKAKTEEAEAYVEAAETDRTAEKNDNQIRIIMKAKGFEDFKLKVKAVSVSQWEFLPKQTLIPFRPH